MANKIFTHTEASNIVEMFENILIENNICVPSPEDDEREKDNMIGLYGSTYSDLLDAVEGALVDIIKTAKAGAEVITDTFNDFGGVPSELCNGFRHQCISSTEYYEAKSNIEITFEDEG